MKHNHLHKTLSYLGLNTQEIEIYIALLELQKPSSVSEIERKVSIGRTALYFHVASLQKKDIVREDKSGKVKKFRAVSPEILSRRMGHWASDFQSILPELEGLGMLDSGIPETTVQAMKDAHYEVYSQLANLPKGSEFRVIQSGASLKSDLVGLTDAQWRNIFSTMVERDISTRAIFSDETIKIAQDDFTNATYKIFRKRIWHLRSIEEGFHDYEQMFIYGDKVSFFLTDVGVILTIHHKRIARALTAVFDALWITGKSRQWEK